MLHDLLDGLWLRLQEIAVLQAVHAQGVRLGPEVSVCLVSKSLTLHLNPALQGDLGKTLALYDLQDRRLQASVAVMGKVTEFIQGTAFYASHLPAASHWSSPACTTPAAESMLLDMQRLLSQHSEPCFAVCMLPLMCGMRMR